MDINKIIERIKKIPTRTYVSMVMVIIVIINYILTTMGKPLINLGEEEITYAVNTIINMILIGYAAWENNSISEKAIIADEILFALRDGVISKDEIEDFINKHKVEDIKNEEDKIEG